MVFRDIDKEAIKNNDYTTTTKLTVVEDNFEITDNDYLVEWTYEDYRYVPDTGFLGQFVERIFDGKLKDLPDDLILENKELNLKIGINNKLDNTTTFYDYGNFLITSVSEKDTSGVMSFETSDYTKKFNKLYEDRVDYPCTALELANDVCEQAGVELDTDGYVYVYCVPEEGLNSGTYIITFDEGDETIYGSFSVQDLTNLSSIYVEYKSTGTIYAYINSVDEEGYVYTNRKKVTIVNNPSGRTTLEFKKIKSNFFTNWNFVIANNQFTAEDTLRDVMKSIGKLAYSWIRVGSDNKCHIDFEQTSESDVDSYDELTTDEYYESSKKDNYYGPVNKVLIGLSNVEGENVVIGDSEDKITNIEFYGNTIVYGDINLDEPASLLSVNNDYDMNDYYDRATININGGNENNIIKKEIPTYYSLGRVDGYVDCFSYSAKTLVLNTNTIELNPDWAWYYGTDNTTTGYYECRIPFITTNQNIKRNTTDYPRYLISNVFKPEMLLNGADNSEKIGIFNTTNSSMSVIRVRDRIGQLDLEDFKNRLRNAHNEEYFDKCPLISYVREEPYVRSYSDADINDFNLFIGKNNISFGSTVPSELHVTITKENGDVVTLSGSSIDYETTDVPTEITIYDNPLTYTPFLRKVASDKADKVIGLTYMPLEINSVGHPWLEGDELIKLTNTSDDVLYTYPFDRKITYKGYIKETISSTAPTTRETEYEYTGEVIKKLTQTRIIVDKNSNEISMLTSDIDGQKTRLTSVEQSVEGVKTTIKNIDDANLINRVSTIENSINGIETTLDTVGGNNLILNSVGYFGSDYWMVDDENEGSVKTINDSDVKHNSVSGSALLLQNEDIYQNILAIKNGDYYLTFSYKKLITEATVKMKINDIEIDLNGTTWRSVSQQLTVVGGSIVIALSSDMTNSCEITDLMLVNGTAKSSWSQNSNETYTDTVKIGKGITITSTGSDTSLEATATGIEIKNTKNNSTTSVFDKYGTTTEKLTVNDSISMGNLLLINKVGDQIWISTTR